ncbi:MAG: phage polymerase-related protein [Candidatus Nomurabacteria bacterium]|nr:phage polymerase-related protein [Candidatus Nomurabacteria bacterium]
MRRSVARDYSFLYITCYTSLMQVTSLHKHYDLLQSIHGDKNLVSVYGAGKINKPKVCFIFMNPTSRNISTSPDWKGLRAPWLGTKSTWKLFAQIGILSEKLNIEIQNKKPGDWDEEFCQKVYKEVKKNNYFISNLAKCTFHDSTNPSNKVFKEYRELMLQEIEILKPKIIISFGNQVSSILLEKAINIGETRKKSLDLIVNKKTYKVFPVFYPVGQGMRNIGKSIEDIKFIIKLIE